MHGGRRSHFLSVGCIRPPGIRRVRHIMLTNEYTWLLFVGTPIEAASSYASGGGFFFYLDRIGAPADVSSCATTTYEKSDEDSILCGAINVNRNVASDKKNIVLLTLIWYNGRLLWEIPSTLITLYL